LRNVLGAVALFAFVFAALPVGAQSPASIAGTVADAGNHPIAAAKVTITGAGSSSSTTTDSSGRYAFSAIAPGTYEIVVEKGGYDVARESSVYVLAGNALTIDFHLAAQTFTSLQTIASVRTSGGNFNTSPAAIDVVSSDTFVQLGTPSVLDALNQVPGMQISFPGSAANGAAPGAITFSNIRNGLSYETANLIDGHPLAVGAYGDYVTTFLNPALLGSVEVIKGPGATAPEVNNAINGTVNFRTKDPTPDFEPFYTFGTTNTGGSIWAAGASDTTASGRLGWVAGVAGINEFSWLNNTPVYFDPGTGSGNINGVNTYGYGCSGLNGSSSPTPLLGTNPNQFLSRVYNGCTGVGTTTVSAQFNSIAELLKLRYKLGNNTWITGSYFGNQTQANQSGNTSNVVQSVFQPGAGYSGSLKAGSVIDVLSAAYDAQQQFETNNEPILQLEMNTSFSNNDTLLARYYHATIERDQTAGYSDPFTPYTQSSNIYGTLPAFSAPFDGKSVPIQFYNYYNEPETDRLTGYSLEYVHPVSVNNDLSASADYTQSESSDFYNDLAYQEYQCQIGTVPGGYCYNTKTTLPTGSEQNFLNVLLRDREQFAPKLSGIFSLYQNVYHSSYATNCENSSNTPASGSATNTVCLPDGYLNTWTQGSYTVPPAYVSNVPVNFNSTTLHHMDPRAGFEWRPHSNLAVRFSMGSSIAPPFLYVLSQPNGAITPPSQYAPGAFATESINAGNLRPETAWAYDLGSDFAWHDGVTFTRADVYETNLYNQFEDETYVKGVCGSACTKYPDTPLEVSSYTNLSNARYEGIELGIKRAPAWGLGYLVQGSTQRGYAYNLPPNFYCSFVPSKVNGPCNPSTYNTNLNIIAGQNYQGEFINSSGSTTYYVDNQSVPYLQGTAAIDYRLKDGLYALFGDTLYGKNNSLNRPPFGVAYASLSYPVNSSITLQVSGRNIFNTYSGLFPVYGGGVTVPLANGQSAGTIGNVWGPAQYFFSIRKTFGSEQPLGGTGRAPRDSTAP